MKVLWALLPTTFKVLSVVAVDGVDTETRFSGKAGVGVPVSDASASMVKSPLTADDADDLGVGGIGR